MNMKKMIVLNVILAIFIVLTVVGIEKFKNYRYEPYNALTDVRNYDGWKDEVLEEKDVPDGILENADMIIDEYKDKLKDAGFEDLEITRFYILFDNRDRSFDTKYIIVDKKANEVIANFFLWHDEEGELKKIRNDYFDVSDEDFYKLNENVINISYFKIKDKLKKNIIKNAKEKVNENWLIDEKYSYDLFTNDVARTEKHRVIFLYL